MKAIKLVSNLFVLLLLVYLLSACSPPPEPEPAPLTYEDTATYQVVVSSFWSNSTYFYCDTFIRIDNHTYELYDEDNVLLNAFTVKPKLNIIIRRQ